MIANQDGFIDRVALMAYICELTVGHHVYLDNQGSHTLITISSHQPGQQQQTRSTLATGAWTAPPEAYQSTVGIMIKITTQQGNHFIHIQGSSISLVDQRQWVDQLFDPPLPMQQVPTIPSPMIQPMQPMQPMKMGDMQMSMNPMEMQMGSMEMRMGSADPSPPQFCSQCGLKVAPEDRFCSGCGHALQRKS